MNLFLEFRSFYYNAGFYISFGTLLICIIFLCIFWIKGIEYIRIILYKNLPTKALLKEILRNKKLKNNINNDDKNKKPFDNEIKIRKNKSAKTINKHKMNVLITKKNNPPPRGNNIKKLEQYLKERKLAKSSERNNDKEDNFSDFNKEGNIEILKENHLSRNNKKFRSRKSEKITNLIKEGVSHETISSKENFIKFNSNINLNFDNEKDYEQNPGDNFFKNENEENTENTEKKEKEANEEKEDPFIIKKNEPKAPSKFKTQYSTQEIEIKKEVIESNKKENKKEEKIEDNKEEKKENKKDEKNDDNSSKKGILDKIKMFQDKAESGEGAKEKTEKIKKSVTINETSIKKESDKSKEDRMNKAMQRIKKKREKDTEQNAESGNDGTNKSNKIKNMASMLESQISKNFDIAQKNETNDINIHNSKSSKNVVNNKGEDDAFNKIISMLDNQPGKVMIKRKKTKKFFEDDS
jgi:hypothetical protein